MLVRKAYLEAPDCLSSKSVTGGGTPEGRGGALGTILFDNGNNNNATLRPLSRMIEDTVDFNWSSNNMKYHNHRLIFVFSLYTFH